MRQSLHGFLQFCVQRRSFKPCWLPPPVDDSEHVLPKRVGYPLTDAQILRLLNAIPSTDTGRRWRFAIQLMAVYGLRPEDLRYIHTRQAGTELWSGYEKSQGGRKGAKTPPRRLYPLPLHDVDGPLDWVLQQRVQAGEELPPLGQPGKAGEALGTYLRRMPMWESLAVEAAREKQQLTPYSFRHRYSAEGHRRGLQPKQLADAMGHSLEVHMSSYARFMSRDLANAFEAANATSQSLSQKAK
jgi:integrase